MALVKSIRRLVFAAATGFCALFHLPILAGTAVPFATNGTAASLVRFADAVAASIATWGATTVALGVGVFVH